MLADFDLAANTISLPAKTSLFTRGEDARFVYIVCAGYLKLTAGSSYEREMIIRVAVPGSTIGLYAVLSQGFHEVSAQSLNTAHLRAIERERFLIFLRQHNEAQLRAMQFICQEYRCALQVASRIALSETGAARLGQLLLDFAHQVGGHRENGVFQFPLLLTHQEMASMIFTMRETVNRMLGQFRKDGWISIKDELVAIHHPEKL